MSALAGAADPAFRQVAERVHAAVPEERPAPARRFDLREVALDDEHLLARARFRDDDTRWIADERPPPEFDLGVARLLDPHAVHGDDEDAVGDRVASLDGLPGSELCRAEFRLVARQP